MKRPKQHVEENISSQILTQVIPSDWIIRDIVPDYGLDKSVEVVENGKVTGKEFLVQVKGTTNMKIINNKISYALKVSNLRYYLQKDVPVILVVVDINKKKCYWLFIQEYLYDILERSRSVLDNKITKTVQIPIENEVSSTILKLREIATAGPTYILSKRLDNIPIEHLERWKDNAEAIPKLLKVSSKLLQKQFQVKFEVAYCYEKENNQDKSREVLFQIANQAKSEDQATYIKAIFAIIHQMNPYAHNKEILELLDSIKKIVEKPGNNSFQIYWWGNFLETVFVKLIKDYNSERTLHLVASQSPRSSLAPFLGIEISKTINGLYQAEKDFVQLLVKTYQNKEFYIYVDFLKRLAKMQWLWCYNNSLRGDRAVITSQIKSIESTLLFAEQLATIISEDLEFNIILDLAYLYNSIEENKLRDEYSKSAMELAKKLGHKGYEHGVDAAKEFFKKSLTIPYLLGMKDKPTAKKKITDEEEEKMVKYLLEIGGIDITSNNALSELARIGLKDRNPERILQFCKNLHTEIVNYGPIWDIVALPSTGAKILYCEKKDVAVFGRELDILLNEMKQKKCDNCKNRCPRPNEWKWTHEWHRKRKTPQKMIVIMKNCIKI